MRSHAGAWERATETYRAHRILHSTWGPCGRADMGEGPAPSQAANRASKALIRSVVKVFEGFGLVVNTRLLQGVGGRTDGFDAKEGGAPVELVRLRAQGDRIPRTQGLAQDGRGLSIFGPEVIEELRHMRRRHPELSGGGIEVERRWRGRARHGPTRKQGLEGPDQRCRQLLECCVALVVMIRTRILQIVGGLTDGFDIYCHRA